MFPHLLVQDKIFPFIFFLFNNDKIKSNDENVENVNNKFLEILKNNQNEIMNW